MGMKSGKAKKHMSQAMTFIVLFGIVSLFSDMTHEGASSIRGAYLLFWGHLPGSSASPLGWENWWVIPCGMFLDD